MTSFGKGVEESEPCVLLIGLEIGTVSLENSLAVSQSVKYGVTGDPGNSTPLYALKRTETSAETCT